MARLNAPIARIPDLSVAGIVTLTSAVDPAVGASGSAFFEYGPTTAYGLTAPAVLTGSSPALASAALGGLDALPSYGIWHYRLVTNVWGDTYNGPDETFARSWPSTNPVAVVSDTVPGLANAVFSSFGTPAINNRGDIAFQGVIKGAGISTANNSVVWVESDPYSRLVARSGDVAPGVPGGIFAGFSDPVFNNSGELAFVGILALGHGGVTAQTSRGIWVTNSGSLRLVARLKTPGMVPTQPWAGFAAFSQLVLPDTGRPIFLGRLAVGMGRVNSTNDEGVWVAGATGKLQTVLRKGDRVSVRGAWKIVSALSGFTGDGENRSFTPNGNVLLLATFTDKTEALVRITPSMVKWTLVAEGGAVPGIANAHFRAFYDPAINDSGDIAFRAAYQMNTDPNSGIVGIWADKKGKRSLVARVGAPPPGMPYSVLTALDDPVFNSKSQLAFLGSFRPHLATEPGTGLWATGTSGKPEIKVRLRRSAAPGYPGGVFFGAIQQFALPNTGRLVFMASLTGAVSSDSNQGIWAIDAAGQVRLIVRKGGGLMIDGAAKQITSLTLLTGASETASQSRAFNDASQVVYKAGFSDGTYGIFQVQL